MQKCMIMLMLIMTLTVSAWASEDFSKTTADHSRTVKITVDQLHFTKDGIFVFVDHHFYPVSAIFADGQGGYVCDFWEHNYNGCWEICPYCHNYYNREITSHCPYCHCSWYD